MSDWKKEFLKEAGVPEDKLDEFESTLKAMADEASAAGVEFKEKGNDEGVESGLDTSPLPTTSTPPPAASAAAPSADDEDEPNSEPVPEPAATKGATEQDVLTKDTFAGVVRELWEKVDARLGTLEAEISAVQSSVKELQVSDSEKIARTKEVTPTFSLESILKEMTPIGNEAALVDGRTKEGKDAPAETEQGSTKPITNIGFLDGLIHGSQNPQGG